MFMTARKVQVWVHARTAFYLSEPLRPSNTGYFPVGGREASLLLRPRHGSGDATYSADVVANSSLDARCRCPRIRPLRFIVDLQSQDSGYGTAG